MEGTTKAFSLTNRDRSPLIHPDLKDISMIPCNLLCLSLRYFSVDESFWFDLNLHCMLYDSEDENERRIYKAGTIAKTIPSDWGNNRGCITAGWTFKQ